MKKEFVIFEPPTGEGIEAIQSVGYFAKKKGKYILVEYYIKEYEEPLSKELINFIIDQCKPLPVRFITNAGLDLHRKEIVDNKYKSMTIKRVNYEYAQRQGLVHN